MDPEATRATIMAHAERLFTEDGFAATSIRDIAAAAGVSVGLVMHHFRSKAALWDAVKEARFATYAEPQAEALRQRPGDHRLLIDSLRGYFAWIAAHPGYLRLKAWRDLERTGQLSAQELALLDLGRLRMRQARDAGLLRREVDPDLALFAVFAMLEGWFTCPRRVAFAARDDGAADARYLDTVLELLAGGLLRQPEAAP